MKALKNAAVAVSSVLIAGVASAQTAPTSATELVQAIDVTSTTTGLWAAAGVVIGVILVIFSARKIIGFFRG